MLLLGACRGAARPSSEDEALARTIDSLIPGVEQATGLTFKRKPRARMVDRAEAAAFLRRNLAEQLGGERGRHLAASYRLLGLLPDSVDLGALLGALLTEQVAGYYDPDSGAFFGVRGGNSVVFVTTVSHELVHALQHDHLPLDSIQDDRSDADRLLAAQSVLEGQATLAMMRMNPQIGDRALAPEFWEEFRDQARAQTTQMPMLAAAPRLIQEALTFPYFAGAEYMRWWVTTHPAGEQPYGAAMPRSSEEILAPERARNGDRPLRITFTGGPTPAYTDVLGAAETRLLLAAGRGVETLDDPTVLGWGGDRFALYDTPEGEALVWIAVFDAVPARDRAMRALAPHPPRGPIFGARPGYSGQVTMTWISDRPGIRLVVAPTNWALWNSLPSATAAPEN